MEHGTTCHLSTCLSLTFLPLSCAFCRQAFCESHFLPAQHDCTAPGARESSRTLSESELAKRILRTSQRQRGETGEGVGGMGTGRLPCQRRGCKGFSLVVGGSVGGGEERKTGLAVRSGGEMVQHKAPSCERCKGLYCSSHITPRSHDCTAPAPVTQGHQKMVDAGERKRKAREILAKNFPSRSGGTASSSKK